MAAPTAPNHSPFAAALALVELNTQRALSSLQQSDEPALEPAFAALQQALAQLAAQGSSLQVLDRATIRRLNHVGQCLDDLYQALTRSGAVVQMRLHNLLPPQAPATYGRQGASLGRARTAAAFTSLSA